MQTFLPYASYVETALCLDDKRLIKQILEAVQIFKVIKNPLAKGWQNHPAVNQWRNHPGQLMRYAYTLCHEYTTRFNKTHKYEDQIREYLKLNLIEGQPKFVTNSAYNDNHKAILLGKDFNYYRNWFAGIQPAIMVNGKWPYIWPSKEGMI